MSERVAASLLLVHGAGNGPWIFDGWANDFPRLRVRTVDLHEGLDIARASMHDYADSLGAAAGQLPRPVSLCGWSMGGLVVVIAAERVRPHSVVLIEPSPPAEAQGFAPDTALRPGTFDPEQVYGAFPPGVAARPESELAWDSSSIRASARRSPLSSKPHSQAVLRSGAERKVAPLRASS